MFAHVNVMYVNLYRVVCQDVSYKNHKKPTRVTYALGTSCIYRAVVRTAQPKVHPTKIDIGTFTYSHACKKEASVPKKREKDKKKET